jgi:hypothetical protein
LCLRSPVEFNPKVFATGFPSQSGKELEKTGIVVPALAELVVNLSQRRQSSGRLGIRTYGKPRGKSLRSESP